MCLPLCCFQQENTNSTFMNGLQHTNNLHKKTFPNAEEELVEWAKREFGGVTSFTTIQNPKMINWTSSSGENLSRIDLRTPSSHFVNHT